jgi:hypothetical protein
MANENDINLPIKKDIVIAKGRRAKLICPFPFVFKSITNLNFSKDGLPTVFPANSPITLSDLVRVTYITYKQIYDDENADPECRRAEIEVIPDDKIYNSQLFKLVKNFNSENSLNRGRTYGRYGIWGYERNNLILRGFKVITASDNDGEIDCFIPQLDC